MKPKLRLRSLTAGLLLLTSISASAHIGYGGRDFGTLVPNAAPVTIENQSVTGNYGWADGTDDNFADSHRLRAYRFTLDQPALVTITFSGSTNGGTRDGSIKPGFSVYRGLANLPPRPPGHSADHDGSPITQAWLASLGGIQPKKGAFRALHTWRIGGDFQTGPTFDFEDPDTGLSTFTFMGYAVDGDASLFGNTPGILGDGNADGTVTGTFLLDPGNYSIFVGGANYQGQFEPDTTIYGLTGTVSATAFTHTVNDPAPTEGAPYKHEIILGPNQTGGFSDHVGAWSWEDNSLFSPGQTPVGWTHTSNWVSLKLTHDTLLTISMERDPNVPWPSSDDPDRKADTSSMFPSFTLWRGLQTTGTQGHAYHNRGAVSWAPQLTYLDHLDNSTEETVTRTIFLPKGAYTLALGSNAPANNTLRQGYHVTFTTGDQAATDPVPVPAGIGYAHTVTVRPGSSGHFSNRVGAWSWEDNALFNPGQQPVGWTHTSRWLALNVDADEVLFTLRIERDPNVPWPSTDDPDRKADISSMFPSFTVWRHWDNDPVPPGFRNRPDVIAAWEPFGGVPPDLGDWHTYFNRGNVEWAEKLRYLDHVDNATATTITRTYRLKRGQYTFAIGSNAPATNPLQQGFKCSYTASHAPKLIAGDPTPGGIGYTWLASLGAGDSISVSQHTGAWSWEDNALFAPGQPPVGWTHTSRWLALELREAVTLRLTMSRDPNVPWPSVAEPNRLADTSSMFPSLTLWRGWHNSGSDTHTYNNRGPIAWAPTLQYIDHFDNSTETSITRSWTLPPGQYTFALGSNAPANNPLRQGFKLECTADPECVWDTARITGQPRGGTVIEGRPFRMNVRFQGPEAVVQWFKDGRPIPGATHATLAIPMTTADDAGSYTAEVRNPAGWLHSQPAVLNIISIPVLDPATLLPPLEPGQTEPALPPGVVGQVYSWSFGASNPSSLRVTGLPRGLRYDPKSNSITGIPVAHGSFDVTIVASNRAGKSSPLIANLTIHPIPDALIATFTGALGRAPLLNNQLGGHLQFTLSRLGACSAVLKLGTQTLRQSRVITYNGPGSHPAVTMTFPRPGQATVTLTFHLFETGVAQGTVSDGQTTLPFEARTRANAAEAATYAHNYTLAMQPGGDQLGNDRVPQGYAIGGFLCRANGLTRGAILLPDGTAFIISAQLEQGGHLSLYNLLWRNEGSFLAVLHMQGQTSNGDLRLSEASLFKLPDRRGRAHPWLLQTTGFPVTTLEVIGGRFLPGTGLLETLNLAPNPAGNASLTFAHGGVTDPEASLNVNAVEVPDARRGKVRAVSANPALVDLELSVININVSTSGGGAGKATFRTIGDLNKPDRTCNGSFTLHQPDPGTGTVVTLPGIMKGLIVFDGPTPGIYGHFRLRTGTAPNSLRTGAWDLKQGTK